MMEAWRILSGQIPFRDFNTPNGIVPMILQAAFFNIFGVDWFAYCLHAACINGAFCILVYLLLKLLEVSRSLSFFYAFLSGIVFYSAGRRSFYGTTCLLFCIVRNRFGSECIRERTSLVRVSSWVLVPFMCCLAYCSKTDTHSFCSATSCIYYGCHDEKGISQGNVCQYNNSLYLAVFVAFGPLHHV